MCPCCPPLLPRLRVPLLALLLHCHRTSSSHPYAPCCTPSTWCCAHCTPLQSSGCLLHPWLLHDPHASSLHLLYSSLHPLHPSAALRVPRCSRLPPPLRVPLCPLRPLLPTVPSALPVGRRAGHGTTPLHLPHRAARSESTTRVRRQSQGCPIALPSLAAGPSVVRGNCRATVLRPWGCSASVPV